MNNMKLELDKVIFSGLCIGLLLGFIDTYGYAVTGYTTSEMSPIVATILNLALLTSLLRRRPNVIELFISTVISSGFSLSSAITSGMYITYTMLNEVSHGSIEFFPKWLYFTPQPLPSVGSFSFYLFATAVSISGILASYVLSKHFIEKEKLPYPIGLATSLLISVGRILSKPKMLIPLTIGLILQIAVMTCGNPTLDLTPIMQSILPGSSLAISLDIFIFSLAMLIPLNTTLGVGLGNLITYLIITPILVNLNLMFILPSMHASDIALTAAPLIASSIVGFIIVATTHYFITSLGAFKLTIRFLLRSKYLLKNLIVSIILMALPIPVLLLIYRAPTKLILMMPAYMVLQLILVIVTIRVVGELGTASQSTLPPATLALFLSGARGALPYVFLDPFTGTPMPQFMAGSSMNLIKAGKSFNIPPKITSLALTLALLISAPITLIYGHLLLSAYGLSSPKLNLLRWIPVVTWMSMVYRGDISSFNITTLLIGALFSLASLLLIRLGGITGLSLYSILLGTTLTPDVGMLFLIATLIKYVALRLGVDVYESLLTYSALFLSGAGIGVGISTLLSVIGVIS